ncbi:hypothetical protein AK812_SmicGene17291 [Symbiodinium microadriaticum]|uniref:Uncharacterized protein n=1 Tax=Symbiodinium microadriaticum TaxID=2951 RepID=A0A1Q9DY22_SYMMI|nr:hypothetical protein AK812_SmicGene17291 [Symbiodinium microadriaticum]
MFADAKQLGSSVPDSKKRSEERPELFCTRCYERKKGKEYPGWGNRTTQRCFLHTGDSLTKEKKEEKSKKEKKERKEEKRKEAKKEKKQKSMGEGEDANLSITGKRREPTRAQMTKARRYTQWAREKLVCVVPECGVVTQELRVTRDDVDWDAFLLRSSAILSKVPQLPKLLSFRQLLREQYPRVRLKSLLDICGRSRASSPEAQEHFEKNWVRGMRRTLSCPVV